MRNVWASFNSEIEMKATKMAFTSSGIFLKSGYYVNPYEYLLPHTIASSVLSCIILPAYLCYWKDVEQRGISDLFIIN